MAVFAEGYSERTSVGIDLLLSLLLPVVEGDNSEAHGKDNEGTTYHWGEWDEPIG